MNPRPYFIAGGVILVISVVALASFDSIYNAVMESVLVIDPDGMIFDSFKAPPVDIYMKFLIFNITNAHRVMYYGEKPVLQEAGPYVFLESREKYNITWNDDDDTVMFRNLRNFKFVPERSIGTLEDEVTTVNAVLVVVSDFAEENDVIRNLVWPELESKMSVLESHKVGEILFEGWDMPEYDFDFSKLSSLPINATNALNITEGLNGTLYDILMNLSELLPDDVGDALVDNIQFLQPNKIGYMYGRNDADDGHYKIATGRGDMSQYQEIIEWNHDAMLPFWGTDYCNMINGTDGTQVSPHVHKSDTIYVFSSDLCRSLYFYYEKDIDLFETKLYRFIPPAHMLADHIVNPDNICYCPDGVDACLGSGFLNLKPCMMNVPVIMSAPHFYEGDDNERAKLVGLNPVKELHETTLDIQPRTGLVLNAHKKIQINFPLKPHTTLPSFRNVPEVILPILWLDEFATATQHDMDTLDTVLEVPFVVAYSVFGCLAALSVILLVIGIHLRRKMKIFNA